MKTEKKTAGRTHKPPEPRKTGAELSAVRRAAALKSAEVRRANKKAVAPRRTIEVLASDYDRLSSEAATRGITLVKAFGEAVGCYATAKRK
jgi:hypothetical protein